MNDKVFVCVAMAFLPWLGWVVHDRFDLGRPIGIDLMMIAMAWVCIAAHVVVIGRRAK